MVPSKIFDRTLPVFTEGIKIIFASSPQRTCVGLLRGGGESVKKFITFNHSILFNNIQQFTIRIQYVINSIIINSITSQ
jgi:hypothetical protein